jgi:putative ABC transport system ATP-binding protein
MDRMVTTSSSHHHPDPGVHAAPTLSAVSLSKRYGDVVALDDVSLTMTAATSTAVIGPSGSGKSTLLHCIAGFVRPDSGEVYLDGRRIDALGEGAATRLRREHFGFVFQSDQLLDELPAVENVALPLMLGGMSRSAAVAEAAKWFAPLELEGFQDRRPGQLSGGQVQRVAIARAMVVRPSVVVADEPTAALDRATGAATIGLLTRTCRATGAALLVVTHDPEVAAQCDRTIAMRDGRIVQVAAANGAVR